MSHENFSVNSCGHLFLTMRKLEWFIRHFIIFSAVFNYSSMSEHFFFILEHGRVGYLHPLFYLSGIWTRHRKILLDSSSYLPSAKHECYHELRMSLMIQWSLIMLAGIRDLKKRWAFQREAYLPLWCQNVSNTITLCQTMPCHQSNSCTIKDKPIDFMVCFNTSVEMVRVKKVNNDLAWVSVIVHMRHEWLPYKWRRFLVWHLFCLHRYSAICGSLCCILVRIIYI